MSAGTVYGACVVGTDLAELVNVQVTNIKKKDNMIANGGPSESSVWGGFDASSNQ
jgi:hypothetical protein